MQDSTAIFLAGASRGVGREIAKGLIERSLSVVAMLRSIDAQTELEQMGIVSTVADALDATAVEQAMLAHPIWAVVSTIGGLPKDGQRADFLGNKNLIDAAVKAKVQKFILISSIGAGSSATALPPQAMEALKTVLVEKEQAEQYLISSGLNYVIVRPGGLKSEPPTGQGVLTPDPTVSGTIHRADVASLVCQCLQSTSADRKILSAVDRQMVYGKTGFEQLILD